LPNTQPPPPAAGATAPPKERSPPPAAGAHAMASSKELIAHHTGDADQIVRPARVAVLNTSAQRSEMHDRLSAKGHAANASGAVLDAAELFAQASQIDPRPATLLSHINMRLKLGQNVLAAACYERLMELGALNEREHAVAEAKLQQAVVGAGYDAQRVMAAHTIGGAGRRMLGRRRSAQILAAGTLQRGVLRWLRLRGLGPLPLVEHVALLRVGDQPDRSPELLFHRACDDVRTCKVAILSVAPFCKLALQEVQPCAALPFCLTTKTGGRVHGCTLPLRSSTATSTDYSLVLLGRQYTPRAFARAAAALVPAALHCVDECERSHAEATSLEADVQSDPCTSLRSACGPLVATIGPRPTGELWSIRCAGKLLQGRLPPARGLCVRSEPPQSALAPLVGSLSSATLGKLLAALLLEQKILIVSASPHRLAAAAHAATSLLLPLMWRQTYVPVLPPSHHSVLNAPFPFVFGILESHPVTCTGVVVFNVDRGTVSGHLLEPLPHPEAALLHRYMRRPLRPTAGGFDGIAQACLAVLTSVLRDALSLAAAARADSAGALDGERLDAALELLNERFVAGKAAGAPRRFSRLLCEASSFKEFAEQLMGPLELWPSWMHAFQRWTDSEP